MRLILRIITLLKTPLFLRTYYRLFLSTFPKDLKQYFEYILYTHSVLISLIFSKLWIWRGRVHKANQCLC